MAARAEAQESHPPLIFPFPPRLVTTAREPPSDWGVEFVKWRLLRSVLSTPRLRPVPDAALLSLLKLGPEIPIRFLELGNHLVKSILRNT